MGIGGQDVGEMSARSMEGDGDTSVQTFSNLFLKILTEGAIITEAGNLFEYFTNLTSNANPLLRRWLASWGSLQGCPLKFVLFVCLVARTEVSQESLNPRWQINSKSLAV